MSLMSESLSEGLVQRYEIQVSGSDGCTPLWLNANKSGLSSLDSFNGYVRGGLERSLEVDEEKKWGIGYGLDLVTPLHYTSNFVIQQCYAEVRYKHAVLTIGQKEQPMQLKNIELSSGSQTLGINARPIPEVRLSFMNIGVSLGYTIGWPSRGTFHTAG